VLISSAVAGVLVTLGLRTLPGLDRPTTDSVHIGGQDVTAMTEHERLLMRRTGVSFIFQSFGLIPMLSAAENVGVPLRIAGLDYRGREERVAQMLAVVDLTEHARQRPNELSAAASRDRPRPGGQSGSADCRRAHRPARPGDRQADHAAAADCRALRGHHGAGRDAR
jgi:putative ABC transport system ATP-binding protein